MEWDMDASWVSSHEIAYDGDKYIFLDYHAKQTVQ